MRLAIVLGLILCVLGCKRTRERNDALIDSARACAKHGDLACPRPILHVRSLHASQRYYRDALGFRIDWEHGEPPDFGSVSRGDSILFMCQGCQGNPGSWMWIFAPDVDRLHDELVRRGAIIKLKPTDMPWGVREMHVADPDGNVIRFATPLEE
jgi:catechol 2,3-dioxygenase-like lactoylglutathione lyase family enzyme